MNEEIMKSQVAIPNKMESFPNPIFQQYLENNHLLSENGGKIIWMIKTVDDGINMVHAHILTTQKISPTKFKIKYQDNETAYINYEGDKNAEIIYDTNTKSFEISSISFDLKRFSAQIFSKEQNLISELRYYLTEKDTTCENIIDLINRFKGFPELETIDSFLPKIEKLKEQKNIEITKVLLKKNCLELLNFVKKTVVDKYLTDIDNQKYQIKEVFDLIDETESVAIDNPEGVTCTKISGTAAEIYAGLKKFKSELIE
jgi:hypothetical protein